MKAYIILKFHMNRGTNTQQPRYLYFEKLEATLPVDLL